MEVHSRHLLDCVSVNIEDFISRIILLKSYLPEILVVDGVNQN